MKKSDLQKALVVAPPALTMGALPSANDAFQYTAVMLNAATDWLITFALLFAVIMIIFSGIKLMMAGGDEEKKKNATRTFIYALVGVVVVILAKNFVVVIENFFKG